MKKTVLLTTILLCLYANVIAENEISQSTKNNINKIDMLPGKNSNIIVNEISETQKIKEIKEIKGTIKNEPITLNDNVEDFEKISLLKSVLDHCSTSEIVSERTSLANFIVEYSQHIIKKNKITEDEVIKTIVESELAVQNKFGKEVPNNICSEAFVKSSTMSQDWLEVKRKKIIVNEDENSIKKNLMVIINKTKGNNEFI